MKEFRQSELDLKWLVFVFKQHTKVHINRVSCEKTKFNGFLAQLLLATRYVILPAVSVNKSKKTHCIYRIRLTCNLKVQTYVVHI